MECGRRIHKSWPAESAHANLAVLMREAFMALNDLVVAQLAERGFGDMRPAHATVFQCLDDTGTTVSVLARAARR